MPGELSVASGLFLPPETWGSWSTDKVVNLVFKRPLPEEFRLMIDARAYGPNVGKPITLKVGDISQDIVLSGDFQRKTVLVQNPKRTNEIDFIVPNPTSPFEQGLGDDKRRLGVGFRGLEIVW
jgi:phosphoglycerol transferase